MGVCIGSVGGFKYQNVGIRGHTQLEAPARIGLHSGGI